MKLLDFYKKILEDVDILIDENGYLKAKVNDEEEIFVTRKKGIKVLAPLKDVIENFYEEVDGVLKPKGLLFNPIKEVISVENLGLDIYRDAMNVKICSMITILGNNVILSLMNPESQGDLGLELNQCFSNLRKNVPGMKNNATIGDETMIKNWEKFIKHATEEPEVNFVNILTSSDKNKKYTKIGKILISLYEDLNSEDETEKIKIGKVTLRPKDRIVFKSIIKLLMPDIDDKGVVIENTEDKETPTFITLLNMFYKISNRYKEFMEALKHLDVQAYNECKITNEFSKDFINNINKKFSIEKETLPTENELNNTQKVLSIKTNKTTNTKELNIANETRPALKDYTSNTFSIHPVKAALRMQHPEIYAQPAQSFSNPAMTPGFNPVTKTNIATMNINPMQPIQNMGFQQPNFGYQNMQMHNATMTMGTTSPRNLEKPDTLEMKAKGQMVSVLDPSRNSPQVNMYLSQAQQFGAPMMQQPMMVQPTNAFATPMVQQPINFQQPMGFQQPMMQQPMMVQQPYMPMQGYQGYRVG